MNIYKTYVARNIRAASIARRKMNSDYRKIVRSANMCNKFSSMSLKDISIKLLCVPETNDYVVRPDGIYCRFTGIQIWSPTKIYFSPDTYELF